MDDEQVIVIEAGFPRPETYLPVHQTAVCPECGWSGVTLRGDRCECHRAGCRYVWRWPFAEMGLD